MTRATLLHVLDQPTALGPAEVRELEQLAQAFPYCQTAHLLLAKAAHDQGTMLAGQRLRRAATYAADRTLLRRLIEQVEPSRIEAPVVGAEPLAEPPAAAPTAVVVAETAVVAPPASPDLPPPQPAPVSEVAGAPLAATATPAAILPLAATVAVENASQPEPASESEPVLEAAPVATAPTLSVAEIPAPEQVSAPAPELAPSGPSVLLLDQEGAVIPTAEATPEIFPVVVELEIEPDLPAQAPAIRPPVEVGEARFEFGLADPGPAVVPTTYELPGLVDEWAAAAVTRNMGGPAAAAPPAVARPAAAVFTPAAFTGDAAVGYGFGESSRLGYSLQLLNLLTNNAESAEVASFLTASAQPPAAPLPPAGAFFEPDPLLQSHWAMHCPPAPTLPSSLDLINNFLRRQPRLTRPAMLPPAPSAQTDLSVRSTRAEPDLASESLARILVRQGKTARAIEIYEKLMVKQPEKMAYFAAQIQQLQPPA